MSQENVEIVRLVIEANCSDDVEAAIEATIALTDPSWEYTSVTAWVDPGSYHGYEDPPLFPRLGRLLGGVAKRSRRGF